MEVDIKDANHFNAVKLGNLISEPTTFLIWSFTGLPARNCYKIGLLKQQVCVLTWIENQTKPFPTVIKTNSGSHVSALPIVLYIIQRCEQASVFAHRVPWPYTSTWCAQSLQGWGIWSQAISKLRGISISEEHVCLGAVCANTGWRPGEVPEEEPSLSLCCCH